MVSHEHDRYTRTIVQSLVVPHVKSAGAKSFRYSASIFILTKLFFAIAIIDLYQGTAVEKSILTRKLFGVLFPGDHDWQPIIFMYCTIDHVFVSMSIV